MNPVPAKITRPRPLQVLARTRLFRILDQARAQPIIWITAPPGAGKTTLVSHYLEQHKLKNLWYQVDDGDSDIATLFYYLALAARKLAPRSRKPLPQFAPEYLPNLSAFFRLFFDALFSRWKTSHALVFDNCQQIPAGAIFYQAVREALGQLPEGSNVIILSRDDPPAEFAHAQVNGLMARLDWDTLKLSAEETQELVDLKRGNSPSKALWEQLYAQSQGWVAGLLLLLEASTTQDISQLPRREFAPQVLFDYFGSQIFDRMDAGAREILVQSAFLPKMTIPAVQQLTGISHAGRLVEDLHRRNYFIVGHGKDLPVYEYHPLFQTFLLNRAPAMFAPERLRSVMQRAAAILEKSGEAEDSAALYRAANDWASLARLILAQAPALLAQGRNATLEQWLIGLPPVLFDESPWLLYWRGLCRMPFDPRESRRHFERAHARFKTGAELEGSLLACAAVLETYDHESNDFKPADEWIREFEALMISCPDRLPAAVEARVLAASTTIVWRQPQHPLLDRLLARALQLFHATRVAAQRVALSRFLLVCLIWRGELQQARAVVESVKSALDPTRVSPLDLLQVKAWEVILGHQLAEHEFGLRAFEEGLEISRNSGVHLLDGMFYGQGAYLALSMGDLERAEERIESMPANSVRTHDLGFLYHLRSGVALLRGDFASAQREAQASIEMTEKLGSNLPGVNSRIGLAQALIERNEPAAAREQLAWIQRVAREAQSPAFAFWAGLTEAHSWLRDGEEARALAALRTALAIGRSHDYMNAHPFWLPKVMSRLCALALERGIEPEYVKKLIRKRKLTPTPEVLHLDHWPWPLKIHTLGGFRIEKDGAPVRFSGKVQRRPLDLLKITIALGGREVDTQRIIDEFWPEAEGDAAEDALATALRRLRLLLGDSAALVLQDNKLTLDARRVWVDVWALDHLFNREDAAPADFTQALALYQGAFLEKDADASWVWPLRERLRNRFLRELTKQGRLLMQAKQYEEAIRLTEKGLDVDSLAEELYCNLMRCYQALGRRADALSTYERCRKLLSITLGVTPSPETEALYQALRKT